MSGNVLDRLALGTLALVAVIVALTFRDYGLGWDDYTHSQYGELLLAFYTSGFSDRRALSFVNLYLYGGGFDMAAALAAKILPFDLFETRRLVGAAVGILGLAATWRIARRVGGERARLVRAAPPCHVPALLRPHVHQSRRTRRSQWRWRCSCSAWCAHRAVSQSQSAATLLILGLGFGLVDRLAHHGGFGVARRALLPLR